MNVKKIYYFWIGFLISALASAWLYWAWRQKRVVTPEPLVISRKETYQVTPPEPVQEKEHRDDLAAIKGIGPATAKRLNEAGIISYRQLADSSSEKLLEIIGTSRWDPTEWIEQAKNLTR